MSGAYFSQTVQNKIEKFQTKMRGLKLHDDALFVSEKSQFNKKISQKPKNIKQAYAT